MVADALHVLAARAGLVSASAWVSDHLGLISSTLRARPGPPPDVRPDTSTLLPLNEYDLIVVAFSGGKDSTGALLALRDAMALQGANTPVELWHHAVDGEEGVSNFMDWPVTPAYCRAFAEAVGLPLRLQWREGGFEREMLRENQPTGAVVFELPTGGYARVGGTGKPGTRRRFPQVAADLSVRWCSAYLKIDVGASALRNDPRLREGGKALLITGERREESANRARYSSVEVHKASNADRRIDQWRPVLDWTADEVWERMRLAGIQPHPAYEWYGRVSCARCIFGGPSEWATAQALDPGAFGRIAAREREFGATIHRKRSVEELASRGVSRVLEADLARARRVLLSTSYLHPIIVSPNDWRLPAAAGDSTPGPS